MIANLFGKIKSFLTANPQRVKLIGIVILLTIIPLTIGAALTVQNLTQKAGGGGAIRIAGSNGATLIQTPITNVFIELSLPPGWELPQKTTTGYNLVKNAYALVLTSEEGTGITPTPTPTSIPQSSEACTALGGKCIPLVNKGCSSLGAYIYKDSNSSCTGPSYFCCIPVPPTPTSIPTPTPFDCSDIPGLRFQCTTGECNSSDGWLPASQNPKTTCAASGKTCCWNPRSIPTPTPTVTSTLTPTPTPPSTGAGACADDTYCETYIGKDRICIMSSPQQITSPYITPKPPSPICFPKFSGQKDLNCAGVNGQARNDACQSGYCDPDTKKCAIAPTSSPAGAAQHILQSVTIQNMGEGAGGSYPMPITIKDGDQLPTHISWVLRDFFGNEESGQRSVQVAFMDKYGFAATYTADVKLVRPPQASPTSTPTPTPLKFDFNKDGMEDDRDLQYLQDVNNDGTVDSKDYNIVYRAIHPVNSKFDANGDGYINNNDLSFISNQIINNKPLTKDNEKADVNGDGKININDYNAVNSYLNPPTPTLPSSTNTNPSTYNPDLDVNGDGRISNVDVQLASAKYPGGVLTVKGTGKEVTVTLDYLNAILKAIPTQ